MKNCRSCAHKVATVRWRWDGEERNHGYTEPRKYGTTESQILCPLAFIRKRQGTKMTYPEGTHSCFHVDSVLCVQWESGIYKCITAFQSLYLVNMPPSLQGPDNSLDPAWRGTYLLHLRTNCSGGNRFLSILTVRRNYTAI